MTSETTIAKDDKARITSRRIVRALAVTILLMASGIAILGLVHRLWLNQWLMQLLNLNPKQSSPVFDYVAWSELGVVSIVTFLLVRRFDSAYVIRHSLPPPR